MEGEPAHMTCSRKMHENTVYSYVRNREWLIGCFVKARAPVFVSIRLTRGGWAEGGPGQTSLNECPAEPTLSHPQMPLLWQACEGSGPGIFKPLLEHSLELCAAL